ncbi:MAG TPA: hypothetical protein VF337_10295, partial [Candidatus Limnocylindrales bacterium]
MTEEMADSEARQRDEEEVRAVNLAADWEVMSWPEINLRWRTRRRWPTADGWWILAIPLGLLLLTLAYTIYGLLTPQGVNRYWVDFYR